MAVSTPVSTLAASPAGDSHPRRETQDTLWYPPLHHAIDPGETWKKKEIGLYIHIPFCRSICKYCPFNKYPWNAREEESYLKALKKEMEIIAAVPYMQNTTVTAVYFGGGTPTVLKRAQLVELLERCEKAFDISPRAEICVEANPETVDRDKLKALLDRGVNRISFGVQSFRDVFLGIIGRGHRAHHSLTAIETARALGLENIAIDLLYRIPGQTPADWENELNRALALGIDHISTLSLYICPGTTLFAEQGTRQNQPDEETDVIMFERALDILGGSGYHLYTMYDFVKKGKECRHHLINWQAPQGEYVGMGAGAYSYVNRYSYCNHHRLDQYISALNGNENRPRPPVLYGRKLTGKDEMSRFMVLGVYCLSIHKKSFIDTFGIPVEAVYGDTLDRLEKWGLIVNGTDAVTLTPRGRTYVYTVSNAFYTEEFKGMSHQVPVILQETDNREAP